MILRTYVCAECNHMMEVELRSDQWDEAAPMCPNCIERHDGFSVGTPMGQEFKPPAIGGSAVGIAAKMAEHIAEHDYGVADFQSRGEGEAAKVRYRNTNPGERSAWNGQRAALEQAIAIGRENRIRHGSGLEALQHGLRNGAQPDLIELSKRRLMRG